MLICGAIVNAVIFGNMAVMIQSLNRKNTLFQEKIENANEAMTNLKMPVDFRDDVKHYFNYTQNAQNHQKELDSFLVMLSPSLKQRVTSYIFFDTILEHSVFKDQRDAVDSFLNSLSIKLFMPEDQIIKQGSSSSCMYFLARGECDVYVTDCHK
uniref:Cyclic nucleotide-binding domain-containing protein n=1 Tax=Euplotes harpa TaxID=151035 RepID=A0A7S3JFE7_9SPIT|mmetsp:Transcript_34446/g.39841  ORF Transcript_34446/g.39841 Transcript_34446/m.39841 type:complete len:154 (+) Transcript_34446:2-463(+)